MPRSTALFLGLLSAALLALFLGLVRPVLADRDFCFVLLASLLGCILFMWAHSYQATRSLDLFAPRVGFPLVYGVLYGWGSLRWIQEGTEAVAPFLILVCLGIFAYYLGTLLADATRTTAPRRTGVWEMGGTNAVLAGLFGLSILGSVLFALRAGIPILQAKDLTVGRLEVYEAGANRNLFLARMGITAFLIWLAYRRAWLTLGQAPKGLARWGLVLAPYALLVSLSTAARHDTFFLAFGCLVIYHYTAPAAKRRRTLVFAAFLFGGLLAAGLTRMAVSGTEEYWWLRSTAGHGADVSSLALFVEYAQINLSMYVRGAMRLLESIPRYHDYYRGELFLTTLSTVLPGEQLAIGKEITALLGLSFGGGTNPTLLGELYMEYGAWAVFLGMLFYGFLLQRLYQEVLSQVSATWLVLYTFVLYGLVLGLATGALSQLVVWFHVGTLLACLPVLMGRIRFTQQPGPPPTLPATTKG